MYPPTLGGGRWDLGISDLAFEPELGSGISLDTCFAL